MSCSYEQLLTHVRKMGVEVQRRIRMRGDPLGEYVPPRHHAGRVLYGPLIILYNNRPDGSPPPAEPEDTITLAHEFGHHHRHEQRLSLPKYKRYRQFLKDYRDSEWPTRPIADRRNVLEEEEAAWKEARKVLRDLQFSNWDAFKADRKAALKDYRVRLHLL